MLYDFVYVGLYCGTMDTPGNHSLDKVRNATTRNTRHATYTTRNTCNTRYNIRMQHNTYKTRPLPLHFPPPLPFLYSLILSIGRKEEKNGRDFAKGMFTFPFSFLPSSFSFLLCFLSLFLG
jgi:hypothetical protein